MPRLESESVCVLHLTPGRRVAAIPERTARGRGINDRAPNALTKSALRGKAEMGRDWI
jgi:hypothetical protein